VDRPAPAPALEAELVQQWTPLVRSIANAVCRTLPVSVRKDDMMQEGLIGLLLAIRGATSELTATYIRLRVRGAMIDALRKSYSRHLADRVKAIQRAEAAPPDHARHAQIAEAAGLTLDQYHEAIADRSVLHAMYAPDDGAEHAAEYGEPLEALIEAQEVKRLWAAVGKLPERQRHVIQQTFEEGRTLASVAGDLGIAESRACQIRTAAVRKVRAGMG
jgi:RNA polymerase sigma factor for flagellar operon FliA